MSHDRTSTFSPHLGFNSGLGFAKGYGKDSCVFGTTGSGNGSASRQTVSKQRHDHIEEGVAPIRALSQPFLCTPRMSIRRNSTIQGSIDDERGEDRETPPAPRSSLRHRAACKLRSSDRRTSTPSSFFSFSTLSSICGYFGPVSLFSPSEVNEVATKKKHVRFSFIDDGETIDDRAARRLSFLLDDKGSSKPTHRRSLAYMSMNDILFELDTNDYYPDGPATDVPTLIVFRRKKRKRLTRAGRNYPSQLFFSPPRHQKCYPRACLNQSF
jgi:hypothetical protein